MISNLTTFSTVILEKTTPIITATVVDEAGVAIPGSGLDTLTLTLHNADDGPGYAVINGRLNQDVLNANNVTVNGAGLLTWNMQEADTTIQNQGLSPFTPENHRAVFRWTYVSGGIPKVGKHVIDMQVCNLEYTS